MLRSAYRILRFVNKQAFKNGTRRLYRNYPKLVLTLNIGVIYASNNKETMHEIVFEEEIRRATEEGEKYLSELMRVLRTLILQTSIEYQECLINQIEITKINIKVGPVGEHWDALTCHRVRGKELKEELDRYEVLATSIADIVHQQTKASVEAGNQIILKPLNNELQKLQNLCKEQVQEIRRYENQLLLANRDSILQGVIK